jgi:hypothetical protein
LRTLKGVGQHAAAGRQAPPDKRKGCDGDEERSDAAPVLLLVMKRSVDSTKAVIAVLALFVGIFGLAACGGEAEQQLVGTWQLTHIDGNPLPDPYDRMIFSEDGTLTSTIEEAGSDIELPPAQYRVLDDTYLLITPPKEDGAPYVQEYSLEGDTLTFYRRAPEPQQIEQTFQRTS